MKIKSQLLGIAVVVMLAGFLPQNLAQAVTMSPIRIELAANPGEKTNGVVKVYNDDRVERTMYLSVAKFENQDESGEPKFVEGNDQLVAWVKIQSSIFIPSKESREVPFTVEVPNGVDPGGYFGAVFASIIPPTPDGGEVALQSDVGTLLLFRVNGDFPEGETILEFNTKDKKKILNHLPIEFYYRFQNDGADRAQPLGDITIRNLFGGLTKVVSANFGAGNVLPESIRRFESAWVTAGGDEVEVRHDKVVQPELDNFWETVKYQASNFALGRYSADLNLTVNNDASRSYAKSTSFWVLPWQLIVIVLAVILLFILPLVLLLGAILVYLKRRKQRQ